MRLPATSPNATWHRAAGGVALVTTLVVGGCLPELEDPPLTATGEAPAEWRYTVGGPDGPAAGGDSTPSTPSACSGEYTGTLQDPAIDLSPSPCVVKGMIDLQYAPSAKLKALLSGVTRVVGTVRINGDIALESVLPKLAEVSVLKYEGGGAGKTLKLPKTLTKIDNFEVVNTKLTSVQAAVPQTTIAGIQISQNPSLITAYLFSDVKSFGAINVSVNPMLTLFNFGRKATQAGSIDLHDNLQLKTVDPWMSLTQVDGTVQVENCPSLNNLTLLPALQKARTLILSKVGATVVDLGSLQQVENLTVLGLEKQTNVFTVLPKAKVSQSVQLCMPKVPCTLRDAWLKQNAAGLTPLKCSFVEMCTNLPAP